MREKLITLASSDYPAASEILVSFPDEWEPVRTFHRGEVPLYVAAFPTSYEQTRGDHFFGLPPEINHSLTDYRLYKLFEPWPQPLLQVEWDQIKGEGQVVGEVGLRVQLHPIGQAQAWKGEIYGVLWECYLFESRRRDNWQNELTQFWQIVEEDMRVKKIFTLPYEPTFEERYQEFLRQLRYAPDLDFEQWWSKNS